MTVNKDKGKDPWLHKKLDYKGWLRAPPSCVFWGNGREALKNVRAAGCGEEVKYHLLSRMWTCPGSQKFTAAVHTRNWSTELSCPKVWSARKAEGRHEDLPHTSNLLTTNRFLEKRRHGTQQWRYC